MKAESKFKKLVSQNEAWCKDAYGEGRIDWDQGIKEALVSSAPTACAAASVYFGVLANWHANHGVNAVLGGNEDGWGDLQLSLEYRWQCMRAAVTFPDLPLDACVFAHLMSIDDLERSRKAAELQISSISSIKNPKTSIWEDLKFGMFGLEAWSILSGDEQAHEAVASTRYDLGVYRDILDPGIDSLELTNAMLDYHLQQALTASGYPSFYFGLYNLFPVDYFLAKKLGVDCWDMSHPLLSSPLATLPELLDVGSLDFHPSYERWVSRLDELDKQ
jgi:hypothetical protein